MSINDTPRKNKVVEALAASMEDAQSPRLSAVEARIAELESAFQEVAVIALNGRATSTATDALLSRVHGGRE